jgi:hypothetical protein
MNVKNFNGKRSYISYYFFFYLPFAGRRDTAVVTETGYKLDENGVGVRVQLSARIVSTSSIPVLGPSHTGALHHR